MEHLIYAPKNGDYMLLRTDEYGMTHFFTPWFFDFEKVTSYKKDVHSTNIYKFVEKASYIILLSAETIDPTTLHDTHPELFI